MSWNKGEDAVAGGLPVRLYEFVHGGTVHYRYTSADRPVQADNHEWAPLAISDEGIAAGTDNDELTITLPASAGVCQLYTGVPPSSAVRVKIHAFHFDDTDKGVITLWHGSVTNRKRTGAEIAEFSCSSLAATFNRTGVRLSWGRSCPYALYDQNCRVIPAHHAIESEISGITDGLLRTSLPDGIPEGWLNGGYIEYHLNGVTERRGIRVHKEGTLSLFGGVAGLKNGISLKLYPGCDLTTETCESKFNNLLNYGGIPHLPDVNPWKLIKVF